MVRQGDRTHALSQTQMGNGNPWQSGNAEEGGSGGKKFLKTKVIVAPQTQSSLPLDHYYFS
jgi:hypothetical protein